MSNSANSALALALGAGGGFLLWHLLRDEDIPKVERPLGDGAVATQPAKGTCSLKLDRTGLKANGEKVDVAAAVALCKEAGAARLALASDAPAAVYVELNEALRRAGVGLTLGSS